MNIPKTYRKTLWVSVASVAIVVLTLSRSDVDRSPVGPGSQLLQRAQSIPWQADHVAKLPQPKPSASIRVTPFPALPDENATTNFRSLPTPEVTPNIKPLPLMEKVRSPAVSDLAKAPWGAGDQKAPVSESDAMKADPWSQAIANHLEASLGQEVLARHTTPNDEEPSVSIRSLPELASEGQQRQVDSRKIDSPSQDQPSEKKQADEFRALPKISGQELTAEKSSIAFAPKTKEPASLATPISATPISATPYFSPWLQDESVVAASYAQPVEPMAATPIAPAATENPRKKKKVVVAAGDGKTKSSAHASSKTKDEFRLADQPKMGAHYVEDKPQVDPCAVLMEPLAHDFSPDAIDPWLPYESAEAINVYDGKTLNANQRPLVELGRPWYQLGQLSPGSSSITGFHNIATPQFLIFGDSRTGYASNRQNGNSQSLVASQLNLDFDLKITSTERFHAFVSPISNGANNSRWLLDDDEYVRENNFNPVFGYFEGDLGAIAGGLTKQTLPFDLPFAVGVIPLVFQNGVWLEDAILGVAATLPAKNSPRLNISNMDVTFFAGYDKINSDAFPGDDSAARIIGMASFLEMLNGYFEIDYAFLDDRTFDDRSYHNIGIGYSRRYGRFLSNSTRVIVNAGQSTDVVENTADGVLLLSENSLITGFPSNIVPYFNMFAGFDRPQSAARAGVAGGVLRNTGILFESDNLTGYPTLDATANDTFGMSLGVNILSEGFSQQLVVETSMLGVMGDAATRNAAGDQYGVGFRYQLPLSNSVIFRADGMMGFLRNDEDISGIRMEVRKKF